MNTFISDSFENYEESENRRLSTLRSYTVMKTGHDPVFDHLTRTVAQIFDTPLAGISFVDETRVWFKSGFGASLPQSSKSETNLCVHVVRSNEVLVVNDLAKHPIFRENPLVSGEPHLRFYAGAPLIAPDGTCLGTICVMDLRPVHLFTKRDCAILRSFAETVIDNLELRKQSSALQALTKKYSLLADAVNQTDDGVIITDTHLEGRGPSIVYANSAFSKMTGYAPEEIIGNTPRILRGEKTDPCVLNRLDKALQSNEPFEGETVKYRKDGSEFCVNWKVSPVRDRNGQITNYVASYRNVTRERAAERQLADTANRLTSMLESTTDAVVLLDSAWTVTYINRHARAFLCEDGRIVGENFWNLFKKAVNTCFFVNCCQVMATGQPLSFEEFSPLLNAWFKMHAYPTPEGLAIFFHDITNERRVNTELRERRKQIEDIGASLPGAIYQMRIAKDGSLSVPFVSAGITELFGFSPDDVFRDGRLIRGPIVPEDIQQFDARVKESMTNLSPFDHSYRINGPRGLRWIEANALANLDACGDVIWNGLLLDVTDRRNSEDAVAEARDRAEAASRAKSAFLAAMSHEIRTPLNGIIGTTALLMDTTLDCRQSDFATAIRNSGEVLLTIIDDILDFSKIEAGRIQLEHYEFSLYDVLMQVVDLVGENADRKNLELELVLGQGLPDRIMGDAQRLRQVLLNLVGNAVKFTDKGSVTVAASVRPGTENRINLRFDIRDTGIGIAEENHNKLFQCFIQADSSMARSYGGAGLGLAMSKRLVELMNGSVTFSTELNAGSTFSITVPMRAGEGTGRVNSMQDLLNRKRILFISNSATPVAQSAKDAPAMTVQCFLERQTLLRADLDDAQYDCYVLDATALGDDALSKVRRIAALIPSPERRLIVTLPSFTRRVVQQLKRSGVRQILPWPVREADLIDCIGDEVRPGRCGQMNGQPGLGARILVAEDNPINQMLTRTMLQKLGYEVEIAETGHQAVEAVKKRRFDLVLMDCQMPGLDGFEATRIIRQMSGSRIPIVALTAHAVSGDRERCLEAGMDDYLSKPVRIDILATTVEKWVNSSAC